MKIESWSRLNSPGTSLFRNDSLICIQCFFYFYVMRSDRNLAIYGVFDGHGGHRAAEYCMQAVPAQLSVSMSSSASSNQDKMKSMMVETFCEIDKQFCEQATPKGWKDGTTACMVCMLTEKQSPIRLFTPLTSAF